MRPDRIVVGEVRGGEALDMLQAMNTGHDGSARRRTRTRRVTHWRLETMALMSDVDLPVAHVGAQVASAIDVVVHTARLRDGRRVVFQVAAVDELDGAGDPVVVEIFGFGLDRARGSPRVHGHHATGRLVAGRTRTGSRPAVVRGGDRRVGTGVIEAVAVAGLFVLRRCSLTRVMTAERSRRTGQARVRSRVGPTTFRVPRRVLVATGIVAAGFVVAESPGSSVASQRSPSRSRHRRWSPDAAGAAGRSPRRNDSPRRSR